MDSSTPLYRRSVETEIIPRRKRGRRSPALAGSLARLLFVAASLVNATWAVAQDQAEDKPDSASIAKWIDELAAPDYMVREAAQRQLQQAGRAAKTALAAAIKSDDIEQRLRAEQLLRDIRRDELWEPTLIDLQRQDAPVLEVFRDIAEQSGNPINWSRTPKTLDRKVSIAWTGRPYWEAMDEVSRAANVIPRLYDDPSREGLVLTHGFAGTAPISFRGPLRMQLLNARRSLSQTLNFGDAQVDQQDSIDLSYAVHWEQRFALCRYTSRPRVLEATTDAGEDLRIDSKGTFTLMQIVRRQRQLVFSSRLEPPTKPTTKLARLRIELELVAAGDYEVLSLDGFEPGAMAERAGYALDMIGFKQESNHSAITVRLTRPSPYDKMNSAEMVDEYFEVFDASGEVIPFTQNQVFGDKMSVKYVLHVLNKHGAPAGVRCNVGLLRSQRLVEFSFEDIAFPISGM